MLSSRCCSHLPCSKLELDEDRVYKRCSVCKVAYYCSKECQESDWKAGHRNICKPRKVLDCAAASLFSKLLCSFKYPFLKHARQLWKEESGSGVLHYRFPFASSVESVMHLCDTDSLNVEYISLEDEHALRLSVQTEENRDRVLKLIENYGENDSIPVLISVLSMNEEDESNCSVTKIIFLKKDDADEDNNN